MPVAARGEVQFVWRAVSNVVVQENEFNSSDKVYAWDGQKREVTIQIGLMEGNSLMSLEKAMAWQTFILKLNGSEGTFLVQDPVAYALRGLAGETGNAGQVNGANQFGPDLETDGWVPSTTGLFLKGDHISINNRLYQILDDVDSDGAGAATLTIWPFARNNIADAAEILVGADAFGLFRLIEPPEFAWNVDKLRDGFQFGAKESF